MDSSDLKPDQLHRLRDRIRRQLDYLNRFVVRMQELGFVNTDPLMMHGMRARDEIEKLWRASMIANARHGQVRANDPLSTSDPNRA